MNWVKQGGQCLFYSHSFPCYCPLLYHTSNTACFLLLDPTENANNTKLLTVSANGIISSSSKTLYHNGNLGELTAESIAPPKAQDVFNALATKLEASDLADLQQQIDTLRADFEYVPIKINSFTVSPSYLQYGQTRQVVFSWTLNNAVLKTQFWGDVQIDNSKRSHTTANAIGGGGTYTLTVKDNRDHEDTETVTIPVYDAIFYGVSSKDTITNLTDISTPKWQASHTKTFNLNAGVDDYIYYACISTKNPTFKVGGFDGGFSQQAGTITYSNGRTYKVFRSDNKGLGSTTVEVK